MSEPKTPDEFKGAYFQLRKCASDLSAGCAKLQAERDELRKALADRDAKLAALEKQEPVGVVAQDDDGIFVDFHHWPIDGLQIGSDVYAAAGAAPVPEGWQLVPVEPTPEMCAEGLEDEGCTVKDGKRFARAIYSAMLAAAPKEQS